VYVPKTVVVPFAVPEAALIGAWLSERRGSKVSIVVAQRGVRRRMTELATANARESLDMLRVRWLADSGKRDQALSELQEELDLPAYPRRIECYDISNIQGTSSVASMVVFIDGQPRSQEYRRFRIKTVAGANDFASMAEVLGRRFQRWGASGTSVLHGASTSVRQAAAANADEGPDEESQQGTGAQPLTGGMGGISPTALEHEAEQTARDARPEQPESIGGPAEAAAPPDALRGPLEPPQSGVQGRQRPARGVGVSPTNPSLAGGADQRDARPEQPESDDDDALKGWGALPELVIVDGGKGQLSAALDVMRNLGLKAVPLAGLAKQNEELFVQDLAEPIVLDRRSQALYLVQRIRDEAHRFAIQYHRQVRSKTGMASALDAVPGVGPKRKRALLRKFGSLKGIREAPVEEIAATMGFTTSLATKVKESL